ncbi:apoptosis inducing factor family protein [Larkinella soli]|uniref:apoptosis inducing factor family protein n=1 Tax=Larkinella soli TaxID=1770527 RepID=UPI0013E40CDC|nr:apoptosis inducing factor family protein [Larkinella soli]
MALRDYVVARVDELQNGQMKEVKAGETDVLLARVDGTFYALYGKCTHYGAPLAQGALHGRRVRCPWHHACFDLTDGRRLEAPALDGLPTYEVQVRGEEIIVSVPEDTPDRVTNPMAKADPLNPAVYVILGGGAAGAFAAEGLREGGFTGRILMITAEDTVPYDRPNCSKEYLQGEAPEEWMPLRSEAFYRENGIELLKNCRVTQVDVPARRLTLASGETLSCEKLLLCMGGEPRRLGLPGENRPNVFLLRTLADSRRLQETARQSRRAVVIGSSFIGLEGAMSLHKLGYEVTVVGPEPVPFAKVFGEEVGRQIQQWHEDAGIRFRLGRKTDRLEGEEKVGRVVLDNGEVLETDLVLIGIGVSPATGIVSGLALEKDGGIRVDRFLQAADGVFAAGDIAHVPHGDEVYRIEHWKVAGQQGYHAGLNMAGANRPYEAQPFFWSLQQDKTLSYLGHAQGFDRIAFDGRPEDDSFRADYLKDETVRATLTLDRDTELAERDV